MSKSPFSLPPLFALLVLSAPLSAIGQTFVQDAERHAVDPSVTDPLASTNFAWADYDLDGDLRPTTPGGLYLDPDAAAAGAAAVAAQGAK